MLQLVSWDYVPILRLTNKSCRRKCHKQLSYTAIAAAAAITAATSATIPGGIAAAIQQQSQSRPQSQPQPHSAIMDKHLTSVSFHFLSNIYNKFFTDPELKTLIYRVLDIQLKKQ